jgi:hypothetical protein
MPFRLIPAAGKFLAGADHDRALGSERQAASTRGLTTEIRQALSVQEVRRMGTSATVVVGDCEQADAYAVRRSGHKSGS